MMRMMALRADLYGCRDFLGILAVGTLLVVCALVLGPWIILRDTFRLGRFH